MSWEEFKGYIDLDKGREIFPQKIAAEIFASFENSLAMLKKFESAPQPPARKNDCPKMEILEKHARFKLEDPVAVQNHLVGCPRCSRLVLLLIYLDIAHGHAGKTHQACADWIRNLFEQAVREKSAALPA